MTKLLTYLTLLSTALCLLTACDAGGAENITYVVVTSAPSLDAPDNISQQVSQGITEAPPTPVLTATPTPDPAVSLQIGDRYMLDGRYEQAIGVYQSVVNAGESVPAETRAAAAFGIGQAALREGLFQNAVDALTLLIDQFPNDLRAVQAYFLRGDAYLGLSQWQAAVNDFQQYLVLRPGLIDSYTYERIGDAQLALDQYEAAFASYTLATDSNRSLVPQLALREKVARLHLLRSEVAEAVAQYDAILAVAQNVPYRAQIELAAAEALINANQLQPGLARMRRIIEDYETTPQAVQALPVLLANGIPIDEYQQGRIQYFAGNYDAAIEAFNAFTTEAPLTAVPAELHLLLGRAYREIGNAEAAQVAFRTLIEQFPQDALFGEALLETGRTRFLAGENDAAISRYLEIADNYGYLDATAAEALWRAGYLYGTTERPNEARVIFERLASTYPNTEQAISGLFIAASAALQTGDNGAAEQLYTRLANLTGGDEKADAFLQVGRLALQRGDQQAATEALGQAAGAAPDSYYSARAQDILLGRAPFTPPATMVFSFDDVAAVTEAENWLRATFGITQEGPLWPLSPELEADPRVARGRELWTLGAFDEAQTEFLDVLEANRTNGLASYQLAILLRILGSYYPSQVGAANVITAAGVSTLEAPAYIARMRFPTYYRDLVLDASSRRGLDPLLVFSLIRHESLFNTQATAAAGEIGLTQVISNTAEYIAGQLNWPDYQHQDLFQPHAGIEFGSYYLAEQFGRFGTSTYAALAGYNAGPGRAQSWLELSGGDPDAFMSTITIASVRTYIQSIYRNYTIYRALYGTV
ncbi:MAG: hypothetical protein OHK0046_30530 [Anaerolineae bacterium]